MKIAFVFDGLGFGGIERVGIDYVNLCSQLGHEIDVYNLAPSYNAMVENLPKNVNYYPRRLSRNLCPEIYSYGVQKFWWGKYAYALISPFITVLQATKKLFSKKLKYDIAIAFSGHINDLSFVAKKFVNAQSKICWCHGSMLSYLAICDAYTILYKKIDKFVVLSSTGQKDIYAGRKYLYDKKIYKIYNPTFIRNKNINEHIVAELRAKYGDFILMVGRFAKGKGHDVAIKAIKLLKDEGIVKHIVFVGDGDTLENMKQLAFSQGVAELCHFEGAKHNVADYIAASYINILTSQWEGLPTVIIEAMALGKPCVMTNSDDGEVSDGGKYCKLVAVDDAKAVAESLKELYEDREKYDAYSALALDRARAFSPESIKNKLREILD